MPISHEMEWGDDEFTSDDPICTRCTRPFSLHNEVVGITHEDEILDTGLTWVDTYGSIRMQGDGDDW